MANVVTPQRPWGLIVAAVAVAVFAAAVLTYAVLKVNAANADKVTSADDIAGVKSYDYPAGQQHVDTAVDYDRSRPPVGGPHAPPPSWADCTGTVYTVDIRHENAVHSLEHGAVWITYNPDDVSKADIDTLAKLVENKRGRMLSPYAGAGLADQHPVVGPPAEARLGGRQADQAVRRLLHAEQQVHARARRQLREPRLHRQPAGRRRGQRGGRLGRHAERRPDHQRAPAPSDAP